MMLGKVFCACALLLSLEVTGSEYLTVDYEAGNQTELIDLFVADIPIMADFDDCSGSYNFTSARDLVVIMDRSQSIGGESFNKMKTVVESLIKTGIIIHPDFTRITVITFWDDIRVEFDYITSGSLSGCEMFAPNGVWDAVQFVNGYTGRNIVGALEIARSILSVGRLNRPGLAQDVFILTDAENFQGDAIVAARQLQVDRVNVYTVGIGRYLNDVILKNMSSSPADHFYHSGDDWLLLIQFECVEVKMGELANSENPGAYN